MFYQHDLQPSFPGSKPQHCNTIHLTCTGLGGTVLLVDAIYWLETYGPAEKWCIVQKSIKKESMLL